MTYKHGVYGTEVPTSIIPPVRADSGLPVVFGSAPLNLATESAGVNKPVLCYTYAEAVAAMGFQPANPATGLFDYSLSEAIYTHFALFAVAPLVLVNVLDPAEHKTAVTDEAITLAGGMKNLPHTGVIKSSVVVKPTTGDAHPASAYALTFNTDGTLRITATENGPITANAQLKISFTKLDPTAVDDADIIGGVDASTGNSTGLELVNSIYPLFRKVPGSIVAPGHSGGSAVAAVMRAKAANINGVFKAVALIDVPTGTVKKYADVPAWKNDNNITDTHQAVFWPMATLGGSKFHLSMQAASLMCKVDATSVGGEPYKSPSNKNIQADGLCLKDGTEVVLGMDSANYLNGEGIITGLNFNNGWVLWGNRTAAYPGNSDPKDSFLALRRMGNWANNTLILTYFSKVDNPLNKVQVSTVMDSANIWINGLASLGVILGGRVEFLQDENPTTDMMDGIARWHVYIGYATPNRVMDFLIEYDPSYLQTLFAA